MIPWYKPNLWGNEKEFMNEALDSNWIADGPFINKFENHLSNLLNINHIITTSNGTAALYLALSSLNIKQNDEVIIPDYTFSAPANMVCALGATPVFADILPNTWCLSPKSFKEKITKKTKAVIPVHLYGNVCDMDEINSIAKENNIYVIEDVAQAAFSKYKSLYAGTFGDVACFSFGYAKTLTMGEGGAIATNNDYINEKVRLIKNHGMKPTNRYWHEAIGFNFKLTNYQAAMGYAQLLKLNDIKKHKTKIFNIYKKKLQQTDGISMQTFYNYVEPIVSAICFTIDQNKYNLTVEELTKKLLQCNIDSRKGFYNLSSMPIYQNNPRSHDTILPKRVLPKTLLSETTLQKNILPIAKQISSTLISLPSFATLDESQIEYICKNFLNIITEKKLNKFVKMA